MDVTPSFGVTMISEVPSNPQVTLGCGKFARGRLLELHTHRSADKQVATILRSADEQQGCLTAKRGCVWPLQIKV